MGQELYSISPHTRILLWPKKKRKVFIFQKKNLLQWLLTAFCHILFRFANPPKRRSFFLQTLPDLKKGQSRRPCLKLLHGMNHWWKSTSLVNILHPLWIRTPVGQHTNASYELSLLKRMKKGGSKNVCVFCFFSNFGTLMFVWGIFFFEKSSTT